MPAGSALSPDTRRRPDQLLELPVVGRTVSEQGLPDGPGALAQPEPGQAGDRRRSEQLVRERHA